MGYNIAFDVDDKNLIDRLCKDPTSFFRNEYDGYLLFLFGISDEYLITWYAKNAAALDSLTGEKIAFGVFFDKIQVKLKGDTPLFDSPDIVTAMEVNNYRFNKHFINYVENKGMVVVNPIKKLIQSGNFQLFIRKNQLIGLTYIVDAIARRYAITTDLPCILIFNGKNNGIQSNIGKFEILHITQSNVQLLIPLFRKVIGFFNKRLDELSHKEHESNIERIHPPSFIETFQSVSGETISSNSREIRISDAFPENWLKKGSYCKGASQEQNDHDCGNSLKNRDIPEIPDPIQVFISAKSQDYKEAKKLNDFLRNHGIATFFSDDSIAELGNSEYAKIIDKALEIALNLIVVASSIENIESGWVQYEWTTFAIQKRSHNKSGNLLTLLIKDISLKRLPMTLQYHQVFYYDENSFNKILPFIRSHKKR